ncbi:hypothetical protein HYDPIDRAFT_39227 [Hydnomerulius pinastri MD-312]|nr:hypothetical protein HYDPIDRAFT_39227 [Hydnomerulius pinastri MD-312]
MDGLDLTPLLGPGEIGGFIAILFFGCAIVQVYVYYEDFQKDHWTLKALVTITCLFQIGHVAAICATLYIITVVNYGQPQSLAILPHTSALSVYFGAPIAFGVQGFFCYRLYKLSSSMIIPIFCLVLGITRLVLALIMGIAAYTMKDLTSYERQYTPMLTALLAVSAICDLIITVGLCYQLKQRGGGITKHTTLLVNRLVVWTIETGLATSLTEVAELICFLTMPNNSAWMGIHSFASGIYLNSLLAALNRRSRLRRATPEVHEFPTANFASGTTLSNHAIRIDVSRVSDSQPVGKPGDVETSMQF